MSPGFSARVEIGFLVLGHPAAATPIPVPADLATRLAAIDDDAFVLTFLAAQRALANDLNAAVDLAESLDVRERRAGLGALTNALEQLHG